MFLHLFCENKNKKKKKKVKMAYIFLSRRKGGGGGGKRGRKIKTTWDFWNLIGWIFFLFFPHCYFFGGLFVYAQLDFFDNISLSFPKERERFGSRLLSLSLSLHLQRARPKPVPAAKENHHSHYS